MEKATDPAPPRDEVFVPPFAIGKIPETSLPRATFPVERTPEVEWTTPVERLVTVTVPEPLLGERIIPPVESPPKVRV